MIPAPFHLYRLELSLASSRDKLFVTSKVWNTERGYDKALTIILVLGHLDLYLIIGQQMNSSLASMPHV